MATIWNLHCFHKTFPKSNCLEALSSFPIETGFQDPTDFLYSQFALICTNNWVMHLQFICFLLLLLAQQKWNANRFFPFIWFKRRRKKRFAIVRTNPNINLMFTFCRICNICPEKITVKCSLPSIYKGFVWFLGILWLLGIFFFFLIIFLTFFQSFETIRSNKCRKKKSLFKPFGLHIRQK